MRKTTIIGVIGGIASGKSAATKILRENGATIIDADQIAHDVLNREVVVEQLELAFKGFDIVEVAVDESQNKRRIRRKELSKLVFGDSPEHRQRREVLERIVHPIIQSEIKSEIEVWKSRRESNILVLDIPLLFERGWDRECDEVWFIDTPQHKRELFASARGWSAEQLASREASQLAIDVKRQRSDEVIENDDTLQSFETKLRRLIENRYQNLNSRK